MRQHPDSASLEGFDLLSVPERRAVARHALACASCREVLTRRDPSVLFALLALQPIPEEALNRLSERIDLAVGAERPPAAGRRWLSVASVAAALLLAALFGRELGRVESPTVASSRGLQAEPAVVSPPEDSILPARGVDLISTPGEADVVAFALGETQVVMIFDKKLDI